MATLYDANSPVDAYNIEQALKDFADFPDSSDSRFRVSPETMQRTKGSQLNKEVLGVLAVLTIFWSGCYGIAINWSNIKEAFNSAENEIVSRIPEPPYIKFCRKLVEPKP